MLIQTDETAKQTFFLQTFLSHNKPLLLVGPTGTGKSAVTNNFLVKLPKERFETKILNLHFKNELQFNLTRIFLKFIQKFIPGKVLKIP